MMNQLKIFDLDKSLTNKNGPIDGINSSNSSSSTSHYLSTNVSLGNLKCGQHQNELCKTYCNTCQKILCNECSISVQHRSHQKINLLEAINEAKISTENLINESTQIIDVFKDSLKQSMQMIGRIQSKSESVSSEINKTHMHHLKALEQRKKNLIDNLEKIQMNKCKSLNKLKKTFTSFLI